MREIKSHSVCMNEIMQGTRRFDEAISFDGLKHIHIDRPYSLSTVLDDLEAPSEFMIIGRDSNEQANLIFYGFVEKNTNKRKAIETDASTKSISINVTDGETSYSHLIFRKGQGIALSNHNITGEIYNNLGLQNPQELLCRSISNAENRNEGISAVVTPYGAAFGINKNLPNRLKSVNTYKISLEAEKGFFASSNLRPEHNVARYISTPIFMGDPLMVSLQGLNLEDAIKTCHESFTSSCEKEGFNVALCTIVADRNFGNIKTEVYRNK